VGGDELLLLADGVQEPQRVSAEAEQAHRRERGKAEGSAPCHPQALARARGCEHQERQHQPRSDLDPDAHDQRGRGGSEAWARGGGQRQGGGE